MVGVSRCVRSLVIVSVHKILLFMDGARKDREGITSGLVRMKRGVKIITDGCKTQLCCFQFFFIRISRNEIFNVTSSKGLATFPTKQLWYISRSNDMLNYCFIDQYDTKRFNICFAFQLKNI